MYWKYSGNGLYLDDNRSLYHQVQPVTAIQLYSTVIDRQLNLPLILYSSQEQFSAKTGLIGRFK